MQMSYLQITRASHFKITIGAAKFAAYHWANDRRNTMNSSDLMILPVVGGFVLLNFCLIMWTSNRSATLIDTWVKRNGYRLLRKQFAFFKGPYFFRSNNQQTVYRIEIEDAEGQKRTGWVRCGSWMWGLFSNTVDVRWDK
jgi:hypothetical protein